MTGILGETAAGITAGGKIEMLCIGNAMVDVFAPADPAWLDGLGITGPVQHVDGTTAAAVLEKLRRGVPAPVAAAGGAAANVAKIAAMLGVRSAFAGCVGRDDFAGIFTGELEAAGVVPFLGEGEGNTGLCLVLETAPSGRAPCGRTGRQRIAAAPGAALSLDEDAVSEELVSGAEAVVLDGYMLDRHRLVRRVLKLANRHGIPVALDAASVFQIREKTEAVLQYSRNYPLIVFMNADESIMFYSTIRKTAAGDAADLMSEREKEAFILREICPVLKCMTEGDIFPVIVIKLGGRGAVVLAGGNVHRAGTFAVTPKNTVGAGDAFCAAFLSAWIRGRPIRKCASLGNKVARAILSVPGTGVRKEKLAGFARGLG